MRVRVMSDLIRATLPKIIIFNFHLEIDFANNINVSW